MKTRINALPLNFNDLWLLLYSRSFMNHINRHVYSEPKANNISCTTFDLVDIKM